MSNCCAAHLKLTLSVPVAETGQSRNAEDALSDAWLRPRRACSSGAGAGLAGGLHPGSKDSPAACVL